MPIYKHFIRPYLQHPVNRNRKLASLFTFMKWQLAFRFAALLNVWLVVRHETGLRILVRRGLRGITGNIYSGLLEFDEMAFVIHYLRKDDLFVDVGANVGMYTLLAAGLCESRTYSFEPVPNTFFFLKGNIALNNLEGRAICFNKGVGEKQGKLFFSADLDAMNRVIDSSFTGPTVEAEIVTLDSLFPEPFESQTMLKIDTEGFEWNVLKGAEKCLADPRLQAVLVEMNEAEQVDQLLRSHGFTSFSYDPFKRKLSAAAIGEKANLIYVKDISMVQERVSSAKKIRIRKMEF